MFFICTDWRTFLPCELWPTDELINKGNNKKVQSRPELVHHLYKLQAQSLLNDNSEPICNYCCNNRSCLRANRVKIRENQCSCSVWDSKGLMVWRAVVSHAGSHVWHLKVKINSFRIFFLESLDPCKNKVMVRGKTFEKCCSFFYSCTFVTHKKKAWEDTSPSTRTSPLKCNAAYHFKNVNSVHVCLI